MLGEGWTITKSGKNCHHHFGAMARRDNIWVYSLWMGRQGKLTDNTGRYTCLYLSKYEIIRTIMQNIVKGICILQENDVNLHYQNTDIFLMHVACLVWYAEYSTRFFCPNSSSSHPPACVSPVESHSHVSLTISVSHIHRIIMEIRTGIQTRMAGSMEG